MPEIPELKEYYVHFSFKNGDEIDVMPCKEEPNIIMLGLCGPWRKGLIATDNAYKLYEIFGDELAMLQEENALYHANEGCTGPEGYQMSGEFELDEEARTIYHTEHETCTIVWELKEH